MLSILDDIITELGTVTFPLTVVIRDSEDESEMSYPQVVVSEISSIPDSIDSISGGLEEYSTALGYQIDVQTQAAIVVEDDVDVVYNKKQLGHMILAICDSALFSKFLLQRRSVNGMKIDDVTYRTIGRYENVMTLDNIAYRP
jgi:hypothetical protein